jgi:uncharacterized membrane protein YfcA
VPAALAGIGAALAAMLPADAFRILFGAVFLFMTGCLFVHASR